MVEAVRALAKHFVKKRLNERIIYIVLRYLALMERPRTQKVFGRSNIIWCTI